MPKKRKPDARYAEQPAVAAILKKLQSKRGATIAELAEGREAHSIRSVLSRLRTVAGLDVERTADPRRGTVYRVVRR